MARLIQKLLMLPFAMRQYRLAKARPVLDREAFIHRIAEQGGDQAAASLIWNELQDWIVADGFTPYPTDSLESIFGIAEEERDEDLVRHMLSELNAPWPDQSLLSQFGSVDTPLAIATLIARCRTYR